MRKIHLALAIATGLSIGGSFASPAHAQADADRAAARQLGEAGEAALEAKDYKTAEDKFRRADTLVHAPTLLLGLARALAGEGKLLEAQETYKRIVREGVAPGSPAVFQRALEDAAKEVETVSPRIGNVTISVKTAGGEAAPANLQVALDGAPVNAALLGVRRPANPGTHVLHVTADGYKAVDLKVDVPVGGTVDAPVTLEKDANAAQTAPAVASTPPADAASTTTGASPEQPANAGGGGPGIWPWVALGVGAAGLITGGVTGAMAMGVHSDLSSACDSSGICHSDQQSKVDNYNTLGTISTVGFIVGGVGAATGVLLLVLKPNLTSGSGAASTGVRVYPVLGLGSAGAAGTF